MRMQRKREKAKERGTKREIEYTWRDRVENANYVIASSISRDDGERE